MIFLFLIGLLNARKKGSNHREAILLMTFIILNRMVSMIRGGKYCGNPFLSKYILFLSLSLWAEEANGLRWKERVDQLHSMHFGTLPV